MRMALRRARQAGKRGEVPVGAVLTLGEDILASGGNTRAAQRDIFGHAEIVALRRAARGSEDWRLDGSTMYVTLEPCPMCVAAMLAARVQRVVFGARDPIAGAVVSILNLADYPGLPHHMAYLGGVQEAECSALLKGFFAARRTHRAVDETKWRDG